MLYIYLIKEIRVYMNDSGVEMGFLVGGDLEAKPYGELLVDSGEVEKRGGAPHTQRVEIESIYPIANKTSRDSIPNGRSRDRSWSLA